MKALIFTCLAALLPATPLLAQTVAQTPAPDPAKVAEYQQRFQHGRALEQAGQLTQARAIFEGILTEQPDAKGSLLESGRISLALNEPAKAAAYLEKLHALVPQFPDAIEMLIQADEALGRDVPADQLVREFRSLHDNSTVTAFRNSLFFEREHVPLDGGTQVLISQFFDYRQPPYVVLKAELFNAQHQRQRVLLLKYDPAGTQSVHQKDAKLAKDQVFMLAEPSYSGSRLTKIDVYKELMVTPDYNKARSLLLDVFTTSPKPILSEPVEDARP